MKLIKDTKKYHKTGAFIKSSKFIISQHTNITFQSNLLKNIFVKSMLFFIEELII